jgi:hypothetical protein
MYIYMNVVGLSKVTQFVTKLIQFDIKHLLVTLITLQQTSSY